MAGGKPQMQGLKQWLAVAVGLTLCLSGFQQHGCLLLLRLYVKKALDTAKVSVSWALLPLLTDHMLSCRRHWSLPTRSKGGRLTQVDAAQCYNHASMLTGSHLIRKCLLLSSPDWKKCALLAVYFLSATGHMPGKFPTDQWIKAVHWHGDPKGIAVINTEAERADATTLLAPLENVLENVVVEAESKQGG